MRISVTPRHRPLDSASSDIVGDVRQMGLNEPPRQEVYFPYWQAEKTGWSRAISPFAPRAIPWPSVAVREAVYGPSIATSPSLTS